MYSCVMGSGVEECLIEMGKVCGWGGGGWGVVGFFFFQAEDGIRDTSVTGVQTCALPIFIYCNHNFLFFINRFLILIVICMSMNKKEHVCQPFFVVRSMIKN